jgi:hypothetical protein
MPGLRSFVARFALLPALVGISLVVGFIVPCVFEWGEEPWNRSRYYGLERGAVLALVMTIMATATCTLVRGETVQKPVEQSSTRRLQFGLLGLFVAMTLEAMLFATIPLLKTPIVVALVLAVILAILVWAFTCDWTVRGRVVSLLAIQYLPFAWLIAFNVPFGHTSGLAINIPLCPGILFGELFRGLVGLDQSIAGTVAIVIVVLQLLIGAWLARRGGKLFIAYAILVLIISSLSSLMIHALYRM